MLRNKLVEVYLRPAAAWVAAIVHNFFNYVCQGISAVALGGNWSLTDSKIQQSGLTQDKKVEQGVYEKTAGTGGPERIFRD